MPLLLLIALSCALVGWAIIYLAAKVERRRTEARPSPRLQNLSKNGVDSGGKRRTWEDDQTRRKRRDSRTLATKDERHRFVSKWHPLGFETYRAYRFI